MLEGTGTLYSWICRHIMNFTGGGFKVLFAFQHHPIARGATTFSKLWVQFLGLVYCTEQNTDAIPSFVVCSLLRNGNHTLHQKSWSGPSKFFWGLRTHSCPPWLRPCLLHPAPPAVSFALKSILVGVLAGTSPTDNFIYTHAYDLVSIATTARHS